MRYLFASLFLIAFLSGVVTWVLNHPNDSNSGLIKGMFSAVGLSQRESFNRLQTAKIVKDSDNKMTRMREVMNDLAKSQTDLVDDLRDQRQLIENNNARIESFSVMVSNFTDKNNMDILRTKEVMNDFNNKSRMLIENGRNLIRVNQEQLNMRKQILEDFTATRIKSSVNENLFHQRAFESLKQRSEFISNISSNVQAVRDQVSRMKDRLKSVERSLTNKEDSRLISNLKDIQAKSEEMLSDLKSSEDRLRDANQEHESRAKEVMEKLDDFINQNAQHFADRQELMREQKRMQDERTEDQMQRLRDQRSH